MDVRANNPSWGSVNGGGERLDSTTITLRALPEHGYRFSHWNDGNTDNPRRVYLTSDTSFTAYFEPKAVYMVRVESSHPMLASVDGGGLYYDGDTAYLEARAAVGVAFVRWTDGDTTNPRRVEVLKDTAFKAEFRMFDYQGIKDCGRKLFEMAPNPAHDKVVVRCERGVGHGELSVRNAAGQEVLHTHIDRPHIELSTYHLPAGLYLVTFTLPDGSSNTQRLVVE